jgi:hypothetical protein
MLKKSRLYCAVQTYKDELFFSLVDYRNSRFTSENLDKIIEFYGSFKNRDDLIEWMKERPKGVANIYEVEGDKEIIVVITTADFNGKYAKECRENIFKGLHMIFVESGGKEDFYFNFAHNSNLGIKKAMEYNPKWIVVSNDDMAKVDDVSKLTEGLRNIDCSSIDFVHSRVKGEYFVLYKENILFWAITLLFNSLVGRQNFEEEIKKRKIFRKFCVTLIWRSKFSTNSHHLFDWLNNALLRRPVAEYRFSADFFVLSSKFVQNFGMRPYDDTFVNYAEDGLLNFLVSNNPAYRFAFIDYSISSLFNKIKGGTLGSGICREFRGFAGDVYFNYVLENYHDFYFHLKDNQCDPSLTSLSILR